MLFFGIRSRKGANFLNQREGGVQHTPENLGETLYEIVKRNISNTRIPFIIKFSKFIYLYGTPNSSAYTEFQPMTKSCIALVTINVHHINCLLLCI